MYDPVRTQRLFLRKCLIDKNGCWNWTGYINDDGYGRFYWLINGSFGCSVAHRYSYEKYIGKLKKHMTIDHLCKNKKCVNPSHLEQVTYRENLFRGSTVAGKNSKKTHCKRGHQFTKENTRINTIISHRVRSKDTVYKTRQCRECNRVYQRTRYRENRLLINVFL